jgi:hypothetical protein
VIVAVEPAATLALMHETGEEFGQVHVPPPVVTAATDTNAVLAGVASVNVPVLQFAGPLLVMVCVYVIFDPAATGLGLPLFVTVRSQATITFVVTLVLLFEDKGSDVVADTDDAAVIELATTVEGTFNTTMMFAVAPAARLGLVQVTVPVEPTAGVVQVQPAGAETD